jgi:hypothetical protein
MHDCFQLAIAAIAATTTTTIKVGGDIMSFNMLNLLHVLQ